MVAHHQNTTQGTEAMATGTKSKSKPKSNSKTKAASPAAKSRSRKKPSFRQRLGRLTVRQACNLLGDEGAKLMQHGRGEFEIDFDRDVYLGRDVFRVTITDHGLTDPTATTTLTIESGRRKSLLASCDQCSVPCAHQGAMLDYLMQAKTVLGLAMPPDESVPLEHLTEVELYRRAVDERKQRASSEKMTVRSTNRKTPWTDYVVTSKQSGSSYRVSIRSMEDADCFCSCPDYRTNQLGFCKHILKVRTRIKKWFTSKQRQRPYRRKTLSVRLAYGAETGVLFNLPHKPDTRLIELIGDADHRPLTDAKESLQIIQAIESLDYPIKIFSDAESYLQRSLVQQRLKSFADTVRKSPADHPLRTELLDATLLPYQLDGIAFSVGAGRAILADDMGLGKTIQGIGVAELLAKQADISRVLVVCPASLKSQWRSEIQRFCGRSTQLIFGSGAERAQQYHSDAFFTICNYEQVLRDITAIETVPWDLVILDEGQRIKNWESKTSRRIRQIESPFRLVLSGTPLENRLGELYTITKFVDNDLLGPAYQFFNRHHIVDDRGKTQAYHRLDELRQKLSRILLRRTRSEIADQLPSRTDEVVRIMGTQEQLDIQNANVARAAQIAAKKYMTEIDRIVLMSCLSNARMACDSTWLLDQEKEEYSSKLERLNELLESLLEDPTRKIVIFSEWKRMLDRIEIQLDEFGADFVRLDGSVPQKKRGALVNRFQTDPQCRVICMTNAGSTGLNLQAANTVINVDLPWNPAVLEQRIARAYRMGQKNPVHVYKLVTVGPPRGETIEERLLDTLASKQDLADASINLDSDVNEVAMVSGMESLKQRLEVVLAPPVAAVDESQQRRVEAEAKNLGDSALIQSQRREKVSRATGQLVTAALSLAGELLDGGAADKPDADSPNAEHETAANAKVDRLAQQLEQCVDRDESTGAMQLKIDLPDPTILRTLAKSLARLLDD
jgi:hypothetical protein